MLSVVYVLVSSLIKIAEELLLRQKSIPIFEAIRKDIFCQFRICYNQNGKYLDLRNGVFFLNFFFNSIEGSVGKLIILGFMIYISWPYLKTFISNPAYL